MSVLLIVLLCLIPITPSLKAASSTERASDEVFSRRMQQMYIEARARNSIGPFEEEDRIDAALAEHEFVKRFNRLIAVLVEFAAQYNSHQSVDLKKIKAVKKAWRDLEKADSWFKLDLKEDRHQDHNGLTTVTGAQK